MKLEDLLMDWIARHPIGGYALMVFLTIVIVKAMVAPDKAGVEKMIRDAHGKGGKR